mgnify:FL=1
MSKNRIYRVACSVLLCVLMLGSILVPSSSDKRSSAASSSLLSTYGSLFGRSGNCVSLSQLQNSSTLAHIKSQYNSITLENEMKPDALLGYSPSLITRDSAKNLGYYVSGSFTESYVPKINFDTVDKVLKICYENGIGVRAHTLVWHSQTPDWFFRVGYSTKYGYVSQDQMNKRMEYYIKTVMNHVYTSKYGSCVYAWDVVNEYLHATTSGWEKIYGARTTRPAFVKHAFQYAYDCIKYFGLTNKVSLFYNDFNTYMEVNDVITMINYINSDGKICNGVGMQSHLSTSYPSVAYYTQAVQSFVNAGFEVQITELDATNKGDQDLANYLYSLMKNVISIKKAGGKITGLTIWGLADDVTWIKGQKPLLFSTIGNPKTAYWSVLQAYKDSGVTQATVTPSSSSSTISNGWYYIKNVNAQKYLQVKNNQGGNSVNVEIGTGTGVRGQKWYVTNTSDGYFTLKNGNGYMLDVQYGANNDGQNIQTYSANNANAQRFKAVKIGNSNAYGIVTKISSGKKALDVYNWSKSDGANVCQWSYYGNANQQWIFEKC